MKIKKYLFTAILTIILWFLVSASAQEFYYDLDPGDPGQDTTDIGKMLAEEWVKPQNSIVNRLREAFKLSNGIYAKSDQKATDYIKNLINIALSLVSFVALIILIYGFYLMFFSQQEEWFTKAKKIFKWVIIALFIMWLSFFIVNFIFYLYNNVGAWGNTVPISVSPSTTTTNII